MVPRLSASDDTIVAIATPPGKGAIGIIRMSGTKAFSIAEKLIGKRPEPGSARYYSFHAEDGSIVDRGIVLSFKGPASYTGEDVIELQAHGSLQLLHYLLGYIVVLGARPARPGEFTERAFLNSKLDLLQAEAVADLIDSSSLTAARNASFSLQGSFSSDVEDILSQLINLRVFVEGSLDFSEEELDFLSDGRVLSQLRSCKERIDKLLQRSKKGMCLRQHKSCVIVGLPNVGKSSLMNQLSGYSAAIVSESSGTTRDLIEQTIAIDGMSMQLIDTAGIRPTDDPVEREGIARAQQALSLADLVIHVKDYTESNKEDEDQIKVPDSAEQVVVYNKIDITRRSAEIVQGNPIEIYLSAKSGAGLELLETQIKQILFGLDSAESVILARQRHIDALERARECLARGLEQLQVDNASELLAEDLRQAQQQLAELKGEFLSDDLLGEIFSRFCIGK